MTAATLSALLLLAAGAVHSFSFMCRKLPAERRPCLYPRTGFGPVLIDLIWVVLFFAGIQLAFTLSLPLGVLAGVIYFVALPFLYQPMIATAIGFEGLKGYLEFLHRRY